MRVFLVTLLLGCTTPAVDLTPDAGVDPTLDAGKPDSGVDAATPDASAPDASAPDAPAWQIPPTVKCADACPTEEWFPTYDPANSYQWSYCLPSYLRCIDDTAPVCQGCP